MSKVPEKLQDSAVATVVMFVMLRKYCSSSQKRKKGLEAIHRPVWSTSCLARATNEHLHETKHVQADALEVSKTFKDPKRPEPSASDKPRGSSVVVAVPATLDCFGLRVLFC